MASTSGKGVSQNVLLEDQDSFKNRKGCVNQVYTIRTVCEKYLEKDV